MAQVLTDCGDYAAALMHIEHGLREQEELFGPKHARVIDGLLSLATVQLLRGETQAAKRVLVKIRAVGGAELERLNRRSSLALLDGSIAQVEGDFERAWAHFEQAQASLAEDPSPAPTMEIGVRLAFAESLADAERYERAAPMIDAVLAGLEEASETSMVLARARFVHARIIASEGQREQAEALVERARAGLAAGEVTQGKLALLEQLDAWAKAGL